MTKNWISMYACVWERVSEETLRVFKYGRKRIYKHKSVVFWCSLALLNSHLPTHATPKIFSSVWLLYPPLIAPQRKPKCKGPFKSCSISNHYETKTIPCTTPGTTSKRTQQPTNNAVWTGWVDQLLHLPHHLFFLTSYHPACPATFSPGSTYLF